MSNRTYFPEMTVAQVREEISRQPRVSMWVVFGGGAGDGLEDGQWVDVSKRAARAFFSHIAGDVSVRAQIGESLDETPVLLIG